MKLVRIQFLNGTDPLDPGVVDQDVHLELDAAQGCQVAEVQLPRLSAGFGGNRPRPGQIRSAICTATPRPASRRAMAAPIPLAPPVINADRPWRPDESSMTDILSDRRRSTALTSGGTGSIDGWPERQGRGAGEIHTVFALGEHNRREEKPSEKP